MYTLLDGKKIAHDITQEITQQLVDEGLEPQLAVILVGNDPASHTYVRLKEKQCRKSGIIFHKYLINEKEGQEALIKTIRFLNNDPSIDALLLQLPLPDGYDQDAAIQEIDYKKDVDGFHPTNIKNYLEGKSQTILPGLSLAVWNLIATAGQKNYLGKSALIVAKSKAFTEPTKKILEDNGMHAETIKPTDPGLKEKTIQADILVTAIGKPDAITKDMVKDGTIVVDIGINKKDGKIVGDVDFNNVAPKCSYITPVPGGVGPMTVAMLLYNTIILARLRNNEASKKT